MFKNRYFQFCLMLMTIYVLTGCDLDTSKEKSAVSIDKDSFSPKSVPAGHDTAYDINLKMSSEGDFELDTKLDIKNTSNDTWNELVFYLIPNVFTEETEYSGSQYKPGTLLIDEVVINGEKVEYELEKDALTVPLKSPLEADGEINVRVKYNFTQPEKGLRYTKSKANYHLAQFYPMLATYRDGGWNKEDYRFGVESFHTSYSDFNFTYEIPEGFTVATTSPNDSYPSATKGSVQASNVNAFFVGILKDPTIIEKKVGHITINVLGFKVDSELHQEVTDIAADAITYFEENIGMYPHDQIDIVLDGIGMEYPGIVTAHSVINGILQLDPEPLKKTVVHELAHQWFYGVISNDSYHDAWLDEGFTTFATDLFYYARNKEEEPYGDVFKEIEIDSKPVNLPMHEYEKEKEGYYFYRKPTVFLWGLFEERGGLKGAENFLSTYYDFYQYKEINSEEFIRFMKQYFDLSDDSVFEDWLKVK
ncbi:M1 family metallopeptidase [Bacillus spongiae]|uniref:M1 family metallopeptidase n=1 Tax=Bacillus spongiae TaxID=2683610 RepID=A0ABU8HFP6_9BACI